MNEFWIKIRKLGLEKTNRSFIKKLIWGLIGGIFVALGACAYLKVVSFQGNNESTNVILIFLGGSLFCAGLLMCFAIGGTLFTGECASFGALVSKDIKFRQYLLNLLAVFLGNYVGCIIIAAIAFSCNIYGNAFNDDVQNNALSIATARFDMSWVDVWKVFLSAILTNVLVVTAVLIWIKVESKTAAVLIILLLIIVFAVSGYQHVVANMFLSSLAIFMKLQNHTMTWELFAKAITISIVISAIGNIFGGIVIPICLFVCTNKKTRYCKITINKED